MRVDPLWLLMEEGTVSPSPPLLLLVFLTCEVMAAPG